MDLVPVENNENNAIEVYHQDDTDKDSGIVFSSESSDTLSVSNDPFLNLPENWAQLDFQRKKSCLLSNVYSTCVNKAMNHLESLQNAIDDWMQRAGEEKRITAQSAKHVSDLVRTRHTSSSSASVKRLELKFLESKPQSKAVTHQSLEIHGLGAKSQSKQPEPTNLNLVVQERPTPYEDLRVDGVLEEVLILFARLEYDRRHTKMLLQQEKDIVKLLRSKLEHYALKRLRDLPILVQKEHEACITDITELQWHIAFNSKLESRLKRKVEVAERVCSQLQEEIENVSKGTPLIEEKISLELQSIRKILENQEEADVSLQKARDVFTEASERNKEAHAKADKESENIKNDLANCRRELFKARKRLQEAIEASRMTAKSVEDSNKNYESNMQQEREEMIKREKNKERNSELMKQNAYIESERFKLKKECDKIAISNETLQNKIEIISKDYDEELAQLNEILFKKEEKFEKIKKKIMEKQVNIEEMERDKTSIEYNIVKEEKNRERISKEKTKSETQLISLSENFQRAKLINDKVLTDLNKERKRYETREEAMRRQINEVKKQMNEERHTLSLVTARLQTELEDFQNAIMDSKFKKQQFELRKEELEARMSEMEKTVMNVEQKKVNLENAIKKLQEDIAFHESNYPVLEQQLQGKVKELEALKVNTSNELKQKTDQLTNMKKHSQELTKKIEEMVASQNVMSKTVDKLNEEIAVLNEICDEITLQLESTERLDVQMQTALKDTVERTKNNELSHHDHMKDRKTYYQNMQDTLEKCLQINKDLAAKYRELQYQVYVLKFQMLFKMEKGLDMHFKVKDKRQIQTLQVRMHNALEDYFNYQVEYGKQNYTKLNNETSVNGEKIVKLEEDFHDSLKHITDFLKNQTEYSVLKQQAMQKVQKEELLEQQLQNSQFLTANKANKPKVNFNLENKVH